MSELAWHSSQNNSMLMTGQNVIGSFIMGHLINSQLISEIQFHLIKSQNMEWAEYSITASISRNDIYPFIVTKCKGRCLKLLIQIYAAVSKLDDTSVWHFSCTVCFKAKDTETKVSHCEETSNPWQHTSKIVTRYLLPWRDARESNKEYIAYYLFKFHHKMRLKVSVILPLWTTGRQKREF